MICISSSLDNPYTYVTHHTHVYLCVYHTQHNTNTVERHTLRSTFPCPFPHLIHGSLEGIPWDNHNIHLHTHLYTLCLLCQYITDPISSTVSLWWTWLFTHTFDQTYQQWYTHIHTCVTYITHHMYTHLFIQLDNHRVQSQWYTHMCVNMTVLVASQPGYFSSLNRHKWMWYCTRWLSHTWSIMSVCIINENTTPWVTCDGDCEYTHVTLLLIDNTHQHTHTSHISVYQCM